MQKFSTWMILCICIIFWLVRIIVAYTDCMAIDFAIKPMDLKMEITMIFVALLSFILIAKRKMLGALIYLIGYGGYFGVNLYNNVINLVNNKPISSDTITILLSFIVMILPLFVLIDLLFDKNKELNPVDKKTDWFYKNDKYNVEKDDRSDKNNYRTL